MIKRLWSFLGISIISLLLTSCGQAMKSNKSVPPKSHVADTDTLVNATRTWRVGLLLPLTGNQAGLGRQVLDAIILSLADSRVDNVNIITFDVGQSQATATKAAYDAVKMNVDVVIGPILSDTVRIVSPILTRANIRTFVLSNDNSIADQKVHVLGISYDAAIKSVLQFAYRQGKQNLAVILPSNQFGNSISKTIAPMADDIGLHTRLTRYYQPANSMLYTSIIRSIARNFYFSLRLDQRGNIYQKNIRNKIPVDGAETETDDNNTTTVLHDMLDTLLIEARGKDLYLLASAIKKNKTTQNLTLLSSDGIIDDLILKNDHARGIIFATTAEEGLSQFRESFRDSFKYTPHRIAVLAYDAFATIAHLMQNDGNLDNIYDQQGFRGVYGEFLFSANGAVSRKFNICRVGNKQLEVLEKIDDFV